MNWSTYTREQYRLLPRKVKYWAKVYGTEAEDLVQEYQLWLLDQGESIFTRLQHYHEPRKASLDEPMFDGEDKTLLDLLPTPEVFTDNTEWKVERAFSAWMNDRVLTEIQYQVIYLHDVLLWPFSQIARESGHLVSNVHMHYRYGIKNIRYYHKLEPAPKARLYPSLQRVIVRMYKDGSSYGEIRQALGLSFSAVYNVVKRSEGA